MVFTRDQYDKIGKFYLDDFPIDDGNQDKMFELFLSLPLYFQGLAINYGFSDTEFRDAVFCYLLDKVFGLTPEQYYESDIAKNYFENEVYPELDFSKIGPSDTACEWW